MMWHKSSFDLRGMVRQRDRKIRIQRGAIIQLKADLEQAKLDHENCCEEFKDQQLKMKTLQGELSRAAFEINVCGPIDHRIKMLKSLHAQQIRELEKCDLCEDSVQYRLCQLHMNEGVIGSHTDEEYRQLEAELKRKGEQVDNLLGQLERALTVTIPRLQDVIDEQR